MAIIDVKVTHDRKQEYLRYSANAKVEYTNIGGRLVKSFCKLVLGERPDMEDISCVFSKIYYHLDCSDFEINILLKMLYANKTKDLLTKEIVMEAKELILSHAYWLSEKCKFFGKQNMWTENHIMMYHTDAYLAGQLYPDEIFKDSGKTGRELMQEVEPKIFDWIRIKGLVGFSEWDSNTYVHVNLCSLLSLYDLAENPVLVEEVRKLLDIIILGIGINSYKGTHGCSHGRSYSRSILTGKNDPAKLLFYMLSCLDEMPELPVAKSAVSLAVSTYVPNPIILDICKDEPQFLIDKEQQSFDVEDGPLLGKGFDDEEDITLYWQNMGYTHRNVVKRNKEIGEKYGIIVHSEVYNEYKYNLDCIRNGIEPEKCRAITYMGRVNKITCKTPEYMLSCAQDFRKGEKGFQQHIWQATLADDAVVFTNHPGTYEEGNGRPDLWAGNGVMPRAVQHDNSLIAIYNIQHECIVPYTHAFFPTDRFDEHCEVGGWMIGRKGDGYVALFSQHGYDKTSKGKYADKELICHSKKNIWICQMGNKQEYGSFENFVSRLLRTKPVLDNLNVTYITPTGKTIQFGWEGPLLVDGKEVSIKNYKRFDNMYCQSEYMTGRYDIWYNGKETTYLFKK
jgi:hypothetical protein